MSDTITISEEERLRLMNMHLRAELLSIQTERDALKGHIAYLGLKQQFQDELERVAKQYGQSDQSLDLDTGVFYSRGGD